MKKLSLILLSVIFAFFLTEIIIRYIIKYPDYGVESSILGVPYSGKEFTYKPYSKYWNVEGGNNVFSRNNAGFNGIDIKPGTDFPKIFVLGNSFIKASEIPPDKIATSIFNKKLSEEGSNFQVVNMGFYAHDPYQLYFLSQYFRTKYQPEAVVLVIERDYGAWLGGHPQPLNFNLPADFGNNETGLKFKLPTLFRNSSAFINLLASAIKLSRGGNNESFTDVSADENNLLTNDIKWLPEELKTTILEFKKSYGEKFILVSIMPKESLNNELAEFCGKNDINCYTDMEVMTKQNRLNQNGHLNELGNKLLGEKLYEYFKKHLHKSK
ncbi:MAG: hypothetical protein HOP31_16125 [Ignavibacteria bacterium]|nr:hypothetical protein [Ignavibacteria bacterium]